MVSKNYQAKETMLVITVGLLVLYFVFKRVFLLDLALVFGLIGVFSFYLSGKIDLVWGWLSRMLGKVTNTVLLGIVFFVVLTPVGLVRRLAKKGRLKRFEPGAASNFSPRGHKFEKKDLENTWVWVAVGLFCSLLPATGAFAQGAASAGSVQGVSAGSASSAPVSRPGTGFAPVKGLTFDSRRHSRDHEAQADSMAVELMRHTSYDLHGALTTLALLDSIDKTISARRRVSKRLDMRLEKLG